MSTVVLIGTGNVARHLFDALRQADTISVIQVVGRNPEALNYFNSFGETVLLGQQITDADIYIIAVSDDAISSVSQSLNLTNKFVVHTSGSQPADTLNPQFRNGVLYPLQTFSKDRNCSLKEVPICIEAENSKDLELLQKVAGELSDRVIELSFLKRRQLHLAAVFVNNFSNHLFYLADELLRVEALPFDLVLPLIHETTAKLNQMTPRDAQTGPARRGDVKTQEEQLLLLKKEGPGELYSLISNSIQKTYAKDL